MARRVFEYDPPERFVAGTVGEPGQRTFYLQASGGGRTTSVALEKMQVAALAERVDEILDTVVRRTGGVTSVPAVVPPELDDRAPLDVPVEEEFRVGTLALGWDPDDERLEVEARAVSEVADVDDEAADDREPADDDEDVDVLRVRLTGAMARAFAARAAAVVAAGRPPCPFCLLPLDPSGHLCPRQNGHRRRP